MRDLMHTWQEYGLEWNLLLLAFSPYIGYLLIFKHYNELRAAIGYDGTEKPSLDVLPWLEEVRA